MNRILIACVTASIAYLPISLFAQERVVVGRFLEHASDSPITIASGRGSFGGWQSSGLTFDYHSKTWWSICDQNGGESRASYLDGSPHRGRFLYRVALADRGPLGKPMRIWWERKSPEFDAVNQSFKNVGTEFIDFESVAADPSRPNMMFACTEGPRPWLVEIHCDQESWKATVKRTIRISTQQNHDRNCDGSRDGVNVNKRWEGLAISRDGKTIYLASEWKDSPSRIYTVSMKDFRQGNWRNVDDNWVPPKVFPKPLVVTPPIDGELSGLCFAPSGQLLALERNSPAIYAINTTTASAQRVDLELRAPAVDGNESGVPIGSASPEGIATNESKLVLISDPYGRLYKSCQDGTDNEKLRNLVPLVFELDLSGLFD
ncbi:MAG: esterase-like activity of phytase family protein [Planctomycetota bacterium]